MEEVGIKKIPSELTASSEYVPWSSSIEGQAREQRNSHKGGVREKNNYKRQSHETKGRPKTII